MTSTSKAYENPHLKVLMLARKIQNQVDYILENDFFRFLNAFSLLWILGTVYNTRWYECKYLGDDNATTRLHYACFFWNENKGASWATAQDEVLYFLVTFHKNANSHATIIQNNSQSESVCPLNSALCSSSKNQIKHWFLVWPKKILLCIYSNS